MKIEFEIIKLPSGIYVLTFNGKKHRHMYVSQLIDIVEQYIWNKLNV